MDPINVDTARIEFDRDGVNLDMERIKVGIVQSELDFLHIELDMVRINLDLVHVRFDADHVKVNTFHIGSDLRGAGPDTPRLDPETGRVVYFLRESSEVPAWSGPGLDSGLYVGKGIDVCARRPGLPPLSASPHRPPDTGSAGPASWNAAAIRSSSPGWVAKSSSARS